MNTRRRRTRRCAPVSPSSAPPAARKRCGRSSRLPALTGSWKDPGGGVYQMPLWEFPILFDRVCRPDLIPEGTRVVNVLQLGAALEWRAWG